jgi:hypothetical protein
MLSSTLLRYVARFANSDSIGDVNPRLAPWATDIPSAWQTGSQPNRNNQTDNDIALTNCGRTRPAYSQETLPLHDPIAKNPA